MICAWPWKPLLMSRDRGQVGVICIALPTVNVVQGRDPCIVAIATIICKGVGQLSQKRSLISCATQGHVVSPESASPTLATHLAKTSLFNSPYRVRQLAEMLASVGRLFHQMMLISVSGAVDIGQAWHLPRAIREVVMWTEVALPTL